MCATCDQAVKLKKTSPSKALELLAGVMKARRDSGKGQTDCLDRAVGIIVGVGEGDQDGEVNGLWEKGRR